MRVLRILVGLLVGVIALAGGVFVALAIAAVAVLVGIIGWFRRGLRGSAAARPPVAAAASGDVIDVSATEVPSQRLDPPDRP